MINLSRTSQKFDAWVDFVQSPAKEGRYIHKDLNHSDAFTKSGYSKGKMSSLEIINTFAGLLSETKNPSSLTRGKELLQGLKNSLQRHYFSGVLGRIRKIVSYIFKSYRFEFSSRARKIDEVQREIEKRLAEQTQIIQPIQKTTIAYQKITTPKELKCFLDNYIQEKEITLEDAKKGLYEFKTYLTELVHAKQNELEMMFNPFDSNALIAFNSRNDLAAASNLNPLMQFAWYWKEAEDFYTNTNLNHIAMYNFQTPESFRKRHEELYSNILNS